MYLTKEYKNTFLEPSTNYSSTPFFIDQEVEQGTYDYW